MKKTLKTTESYRVENYPYGYTQKTTKIYALEYKKGKGFRTVKTTINPKTQKLNKAKRSTYDTVILLSIKKNGHAKYIHHDFYDEKGKNEGWKFMFDNFDKFQPEEIKDIALHNIFLLKVDISAKCTYCGCDHNKLIPLYESALKTLVEISKTGQNLWNEIKVDWEATEDLKVKGFSPFAPTRTMTMMTTRTV